jgi:hypothetical protein
MMVKIDRKLFTKHIGIAATGPESDAISNAVRRELDAYADRKAAFDGHPSVDLMQLVRLRKAWEKTGKSARFLLQGFGTGPGGWPRPDIDLAAFETNLDGAITDLQWILYGRSKKQRPSESARNLTAQNLALVFKQHYCLQRKDYRQNLDAFLRRLFHRHSLSYPDLHDDYKQRDDFLRALRVI